MMKCDDMIYKTYEVAWLDGLAGGVMVSGIALIALGLIGLLASRRT